PTPPQPSPPAIHLHPTPVTLPRKTAARHNGVTTLLIKIIDKTLASSNRMLRAVIDSYGPVDGRDQAPSGVDSARLQPRIALRAVDAKGALGGCPFDQQVLGEIAAELPGIA